MAASAYFDQVQLLYIAYFGRPADPVGLAYWAANVDAANGSLAGVIAGFSASAESAALFGTLPTSQKVSAIYLNLFNRAPEASGLAYWINQIESGAVTQAQAAYQIESQAGAGDATSVANKLAMAKAFTAQIDTAPEVAGYNGAVPAAYGRAYLKGVDATPGSVSIATTSLVDSVATATGVTNNVPTTPTGPAGPTVATTFTLTTGSDTFTGSPQDDIFNGTLGTAATYNTATDTLNGGAGSDTLNLTSSGALGPYTIDGSKVSNIEKLVYTANDGSASTLNLTGTGFSELVNNKSAVATTFSGFGASVTRLGISNISGNATTFNAAGSDLTGTSDALTLTLNTVTAAAPVTITATGSKVGNEYETLNIVSTGTANSIVLGTNTTQSSLSTINISGSANLNLGLASSGDKIATTATTIDAHTATGGVTIGSFSLGLGVANHTVTLGTGSNLVFFGGANTSNLNGGDKVDGSLGNDDTLIITSTSTAPGVSSADLAQVTGIEKMRFMNAAGNLTQDVSQLPVGVGVQLDGIDSAVSFTHMANNSTVEVLSGFRLQMGLASDTGADALTIKMAPATATGVTLTTLASVIGLETLNIVSNAATGQTSANTISTDSVTASQVLTGSGDLTISNAIVSSSFDASAFTGNLSITGQLSVATSIKGGSGNDKIFLGSGADTVDAGAGNDTIYLAPIGTSTHISRGADSITTGLGNDTIVFNDNLAAGNGSLTNYSTIANITDFKVGTSTADTDFLAFVGDDSAYSVATNTGLAKGSTAKGLASGDAMAVLNAAVDAVTLPSSTNVSFLKLTNAVAFNTDIKTTFINSLNNGSVLGLAVNGNYLVSLYDITNSKAVIAVVNTGSDGTIDRSDFTAANIAVVGTLDMTAGDYASFGATQLATVL